MQDNCLCEETFCYHHKITT